MASDFSSLEARNAIHEEMAWEERDVPRTIYEMLTATAEKFPDRPAFSFQITSGPKDKAVTMTWRETHAKVSQAANMFRKLGVQEGDTIAYIMPNCHETAITFLGGMVAGIVNPINPLWNPNRLRQSCARPAQRWL